MNARSPLVALLLTGLLLLAGCGSASTPASNGSSTPGSTTGSSTVSSTTANRQATATIGFEGVPLEQGGPELAPASTTQTGTIDGIRCGATEQLVYHIHAHLGVYVNGAVRVLPPGIGIPSSAAQQTPQGPVAAGGQCIYWLHTHTSDGVIHIESPIKRVYTLGDFFDEWHQPLSTMRVGAANGKVTAFVDGKPWTKDPRSIPLAPHAVIQLNAGSPAAPLQTVSWAQTQL